MHTHFSDRRSHVPGRVFEMVETNSLRRRMERAVEALIAMLDALDGDTDFEPANDDEPSLGWPGVGHGAAGRLDGPAYDSGDDNREFDDSDDEDGGDRERDLCDDEDGGDLEQVCEDEGAQCDEEDEGDDMALFPPSNGKIRSAIDPSLLPESYLLNGEGHCCEPQIHHGDRVLISKTDPIRPGDFVAIYLNRRYVPRGGHQVLVKRLVADGRQGGCKLEDGRPAVLAEMLNPPRLLAFPAEAVLAIHRVVKVDNNSPSYRLTQAAMLADRASLLKADAGAKGAAR